MKHLMGSSHTAHTSDKGEIQYLAQAWVKLLRSSNTLVSEKLHAEVVSTTALAWTHSSWTENDLILKLAEFALENDPKQ